MTAATGPVDEVGELDSDFSAADATPLPWATVRGVIETAEIYWVSTVRPDGRPHVTPLIAVVVDGAPWICTGPAERKARNLATNPRCILTTGCNELGSGIDVVWEGEAVAVTEPDQLERAAEAFNAKYPAPFKFSVRDGVFASIGGPEALVFRIEPVKVLAFGRGDAYSQTRWRFGRPA
jgi:hypothetical protein